MSDQIDVNQLSNALQQKVDLPSGKSQADIDYVIEWKAPTSSDPTWYRLYKSGWVEQGGYKNNNTNVVNLIITMTDTNYWVEIQPQSNSTTSFQARSTHVSSKTTTSVTYTGLDDPAYWQVKGFAAQS